MRRKRDQSYGERALRNQWSYEAQAGRYSERASQARTWEERERMMERAQRAIEKADYWEAERM